MVLRNDPSGKGTKSVVIILQSFSVSILLPILSIIITGSKDWIFHRLIYCKESNFVNEIIHLHDVNHGVIT